MLDPRVRKTVDQLWDLLWSAGLTNPLSVVDYLTGLFLLSPARPGTDSAALAAVALAAKSRDVARCVSLLTAATAALGLGAPDASLWRDPALLARAVRLVARLAPGDRNRDLLGDCFEHVLRRLGTAGHFGQFRTPRHVVRFLVDAVDPRAGETVLDPACGTGGFLIAAHEHRRDAGGGPCLGDECDWTMARIAAANVLLHGLDGAHIRRRDAFASATPEADVILANPPFGGSVDEARRKAFGVRTTKSEVLFVELMLRRLKRGGRAGVVVPTGVLTSPARAAVDLRRRLVRDHGLHAVIELPAGVFLPYTDVRAALLLWRDGAPAGELLLARARTDGFSLDDKREAGGASDLDALLPHARGDVGAAPLSAAIGRRVRARDLGDDYGLSPARHLAGARAKAPRERPTTAVLADAEATVEGLRELLAAMRDDGAAEATGRWTRVALDRLVQAQRATCRPEDIAADALYVGLEHVAAETGVHRAVPAAGADLRSAKLRFARGDILYGKLRPGLRKVAVAHCDGVCSTDLLPLRPADPASAHLLAFQLRSEAFARVVGGLVAGASLPRVAVRDLLTLKVPVPPTAERARLGALARRLDEARAAADRMDAQLAELNRAAAAMLLGEPTRRGG